MYDIFYVTFSEVTDSYQDLKKRYPRARLITHLSSFEDLSRRSFTKMFWVIWDDVELLDSFDLDSYKATKWDDMYVHIFKNDDHKDGIGLFPKNLSVSAKEFQHRYFREKKEIDIQASRPKKYNRFVIDTYNDYLEAAAKSNTEMFWIVPKEVDPFENFDFDLYFSHHNLYDRAMNHVFQNRFNDTTINYNGIMLMSKKKMVSKRELDFRFLIEKKEYPIVASKNSLYDIIFISYNEPNADANYDNLVKRFPRAKRVHGVKGIHQAHIKAAEKSESEMFWVVDGDAIIVDDFNFDHIVNRYERNIVHVWRSQNPINGLVYGYGGVKLLPRELTLAMDVNSTDMTTSISDQFRAVESVSNITAFNTDPFNTWKSAFRECVKLSSKLIVRQNDEETEKRLEIWCSEGSDQQFGEYAISGARTGKEYGISCKGDTKSLSKINDFDWLKKTFDGLQ